MAPIALSTLENPLDWGQTVARAAAWAKEAGFDLRSSVMLLPFAQHLAPARQAWAQLGGWQPRVETTRTLAESLAPTPRADDGQITLDASTDRLHAARLLRSQSWVNKEPRAFDEAVAAVVTTAHALVKAAAAVAPQDRADHWQQGRESMGAAASTAPGGTERALARVALEWAALASSRATDILFTLRPAAWIVIQAGGEDTLVRSLISNNVPSLVLDADVPAREALSRELSLGICDGFEDEAECTAAQVLSYLEQGKAPIALVAQDRSLVRRIRALLERHRVSVQDETGWTLSTTRSAAQVATLLRAARADASTDDLLDWLKAGAWADADRGRAQLETTSRRAGWTQLSSINVAKLPDDAAALHAESMVVLASLQAHRSQVLSAWLVALRFALERSGVLALLSADEAGTQVLRVLRLDDPAAWAGQAAQTRMSFTDFSAWVDAALEEALFKPAPPVGAVSVVITPLARVMLRPFASVVFPGADDRHLGAASAPQSLLNDLQAQALGVPTAAQRREAEALAFAHAMSTSPVTLFHRRSDGAEPLSASALVEQLALRLRRANRELARWIDPRVVQSIKPAPIGMPAPSAAELLPPQLSASACDALRACPYRFHALHLLRLREVDELDDEIEKRDYGTWLHAVLLVFHEQRGERAAPDVECAKLLSIAREQQQIHDLNDADFLPFEAAFSELAPRYIEWLHKRDLEGATWWQGEQDRKARPPEWQGIALQGRIDRMDRVRVETGAAIELIDYKTGSVDALKKKVKQPLEDTQLAFYAALMQAEADTPLRASYLALGRKIERIEHVDVDRSAALLVQGLAQDLARIRQGAGLPALGEEPVCGYCEARGLCRRDHWSTP